MPWVEFGRRILCAGHVMMLERGDADEAGEPSLTVTLAFPRCLDSPTEVDLIGEDAALFLDFFRAYRDVRRIDGSAPASEAAADDGPDVIRGDVAGVEETPPLRPHAAGDHD